jgi:hypothetical protein
VQNSAIAHAQRVAQFRLRSWTFKRIKDIASSRFGQTIPAARRSTFVPNRTGHQAAS